MKIKTIDEAVQQQTELWNWCWVVAKPEEGYGLLKWIIRIKKAIMVLKWEADAFTYSYEIKK